MTSEMPHTMEVINMKLPIPRTKVEVTEEAKIVLQEIIDSGRFIKGPHSKSLGEEFAAYCGAKRGVGVSSGSTALFAALKVAGIGPGDEVITVPNTFIATINAVILAGAKPVFADVDYNTYNIDVDSLRSAISPKTKAIIPVHLYGLMAPMPEIMEIAEKRDLCVIEDACQAHGADIGGKRAGSFGDMAAFSFYPSKLLNTAGDGGIVITKDDETAERVSRFINHGRKSQYDYSEFGFNFRLSELQAAVARLHLRGLDKEIGERKRIASFYDEQLESINGIEPPHVPDNYSHVYYLYTTFAQKRDELIQNLEKAQIGASVEYPVVLHKLEYVRTLNLVITKGGLANSEKCLDHICTLPMFSSISDDELLYIIKKIREFYRS
jgi:dTDP-4-amino-4,6-dideoxygalactose transaminase